MSSHFLSSHHASGHFASAHFGRTIVIPPIVPELPVFPPGTSRPSADVWRKIREEDELILLVIQAFLTMKDRD